MLADRAADEVTRAVADAEARRRLMTIAVAGGSVARACFPRFARLAIDWNQVEVFFADERAVPPADPDSNYGLAHALWLAPARVPAPRVHRMFAAGIDDPAAAVDAYTAALHERAGTPPRLDVVLLGVGEDGHVASVFPGHPVAADERPVAFIADAPKPPPRRMTLTLPVLANADLVMIGALDASKRSAIHAALHDPVASTPAAVLARTARRVVWLIAPGASA